MAQCANKYIGHLRRQLGLERKMLGRLFHLEEPQLAALELGIDGFVEYNYHTTVLAAMLNSLKRVKDKDASFTHRK